MIQAIFSFLFELAGRIIWWCLVELARLARYAVRHPRSSAGLLSAGAAVAMLGWEICLAVVVAAYLAASTWRVAHRASFDRHMGRWVRTWWRRWAVYARRWERVFARCGLVVEVDGGWELPRLTGVETTPYWDRLVVRLALGQDVAAFRDAAEKLRHAFAAERIVVREVRPASVGIDLMRRDPLREPVPAALMPETTDEIDFRALPIGLTETGDPLTVSVLGGHLAASGTTGAGKAGVIWGINRCLAPAIADRLVRLVLIDPKGVELRQGRDLADREDYASTEDTVLSLLQRLVTELEDRKEALGSVGERDFTPTRERPLVLVEIDELAPLLAYWRRSVRDKIEDALGILLTQGRALGFIVVGAIQEPTKDVFGIRDLFGRRLCLRVPTEAHTDAALTEKATDRGAASHEIPEGLPGVLFALESGARSAVRARLGHVTDADIRDLVEFVKARRTVVPLDARRDHSGVAA